ncbi:hypothetical protein GCM10009741_42670 [Kribbella lupini]|uniref:Secreted protein n=1 Tax=Kribbella lupini TaxID=291602 RepID=A0ABP4M374_9ACTN
MRWRDFVRWVTAAARAVMTTKVVTRVEGPSDRPMLRATTAAAASGINLLRAERARWVALVVARGGVARR